MEQLYNAMLANVQIPQVIPTVQKSEPAPKNAFQKLLEQKQGTDASAAAEKPEKAEDVQKPQETQDSQAPQDAKETPEEAEEPVEAAHSTGKELENQLALAAVAMMYNPVVPVEQVMTPEVAEAQVSAVVEEIAPVMVEAVVTPEAEAPVPETEQRSAEIPVEGGEQPQTVDQTVAEEVPQPIEAPEAVQETEGRTVEVKVEVHEAQARPVQEDAEDDSTEETPELQDAEVETPVFADVKAVPVKVGEAPKTEAADKPVEEQIGPRLTEALQNGDTHVEIQLTPENLGKVTVEMTWSKDGNLVVQLHAENRQTQELLGKNMSGLEALLSREVQQEVRVEVPRQEESQERQDLYEQQQNQHKHQQEGRQEQRRNRPSDSENFLQQLRLGLIPLDEE